MRKIKIKANSISLDVGYICISTVLSRLQKQKIKHDLYALSYACYVIICFWLHNTKK